MKHTKILKEFENSEKLLDLKSVIWLVGLEIKHYQASNRDDIIQIFNQLKMICWKSSPMRMVSTY